MVRYFSDVECPEKNRRIKLNNIWMSLSETKFALYHFLFFSTRVLHRSQKTLEFCIEWCGQNFLTMLHSLGTIRQPQLIDRSKARRNKRKLVNKRRREVIDKRYEVAISNFTICWKLEYPISFSLDMSYLHIATWTYSVKACVDQRWMTYLWLAGPNTPHSLTVRKKNMCQIMLDSSWEASHMTRCELNVMFIQIIPRAKCTLYITQPTTSGR